MKESEQKTVNQYLDFILNSYKYNSQSFYKDREGIFYEEKGKIKKLLPYENNRSIFLNEKNKAILIPTGRVGIDEKAKKAVIFYNGTKYGSEIFSDVSFAPAKRNFGDKEYEVHSGLFHEFEESQKTLEYILKDLNKRGIEEITFAGHSMGGAIAPLAALHTKSNNLFKGKISCVTLAAPRVFTAGSAQSYNKLLGDDTVRVHHNEDIITRLPPAVLGFYHIGNNEINLSGNEHIGHNETYYNRGYLLKANVTEIDNKINMAAILVGNFMASLHQPADTLYRGAKTIIYDLPYEKLQNDRKMGFHNLINMGNEEGSIKALNSLFSDKTSYVKFNDAVTHKENGLSPIDLAVKTGQMKLAKKIHEITMRSDYSMLKNHENNNKFDRWLLSEIIKPGNPIEKDHLKYATELIGEGKNKAESIQTFKRLYKLLSEKPEIPEEQKYLLLETASKEVKYYDNSRYNVYKPVITKETEAKSVKDFASLYESLLDESEIAKKKKDDLNKLAKSMINKENQDKKEGKVGQKSVKELASIYESLPDKMQKDALDKIIDSYLDSHLEEFKQKQATKLSTKVSKIQGPDDTPNFSSPITSRNHLMP